MVTELEEDLLPSHDLRNELSSRCKNGTLSPSGLHLFPGSEIERVRPIERTPERSFRNARSCAAVGLTPQFVYVAPNKCARV